MYFEGFDFTGFWDDSDYALKAYVSPAPDDALIAEIEAELGYKLPGSYIWLMKQQNGGIPVNTCCPSDEPTSWAEDHAAIAGIMGIGRDKDYSLCGGLGSRFMIEEWGYPDIGVAFGDCPSAGHDMLFLITGPVGPRASLPWCISTRSVIILSPIWRTILRNLSANCAPKPITTITLNGFLVCYFGRTWYDKA